MLAEATQNQTYHKLGNNSEDFYYNQIRNPQGFLLDGIWADTCNSGNLTFPTNAVGAMIEGLAILLSLSGQENTAEDLEEMVGKAVLEADAQANAQLAAQYVVRGLSTIYIRNISQPALRPYLQKYLAVQYNAVLGNARGSGVNNNIYSASWAREQPASDFSFEQQTNALSILVAAISIRNDTNPPEPPKPPEPSPGPYTARPGAAVIAGVVVAAAVVLFSAGLVTWLIRRRNLRRSVSTDGGLGLTHDPIDVYISTSGHPHRKSKSGGRKEGERLPDGITSQLGGAPENQLTDEDATSNVVRRGVRGPDNSIPTADLVRVLNQRLREREWRQDEPPPDYFSEGAPAARNGSTTGQKRGIVM
ncbi:hypothetical protein PQX77_003251 [Marasmius sp. AFHP31]|nr:hypothetical protein PQX77_003251 [Marasmius sp. AFHP31]